MRLQVVLAVVLAGAAEDAGACTAPNQPSSLTFACSGRLCASIFKGFYFGTSKCVYSFSRTMAQLYIQLVFFSLCVVTNAVSSNVNRRASDEGYDGVEQLQEPEAEQRTD